MNEAGAADQIEKKGPGKGGKRAGAGRPVAPVLLVQYACRVPADDKPYLLAAPEAARRALREVAEAERRRQAAEVTAEPSGN